jgi:hypothetical protein
VGHGGGSSRWQRSVRSGVVWRGRGGHRARRGAKQSGFCLLNDSSQGIRSPACGAAWSVSGDGWNRTAWVGGDSV